MNNDKELVEVWKKEFEDFCEKEKISTKISPDGEMYAFSSTACLWGGWVAAKRSLPSVVLPSSKSFPSIGHPMDKLGVHGYELALSDVKSAITAAGIKYTIGE